MNNEKTCCMNVLKLMLISKSFILLFWLTTCLLSQKAYAQQQTYQIGEIEGWNSFLTLSELEQERVRESQESIERLKHLYAVDSMFREEVPDSLKAQLFEKELERIKEFRFNRSRWDLRSFANNSIQDSTMFGEIYFPWECVCQLEDNQIKIETGWWVFGGTLIEINLNDRTYRSTFIEDAHESTPYKYSLQDSILVNEVTLAIEKSTLTLRQKPTFKIGEFIEGLIELETPIYYVDALYNDGLSGGRGDKMDEMITRGKIFFTCELRPSWRD